MGRVALILELALTSSCRIQDVFWLGPLGPLESVREFQSTLGGSTRGKVTKGIRGVLHRAPSIVTRGTVTKGRVWCTVPYKGHKLACQPGEEGGVPAHQRIGS